MESEAVLAVPDGPYWGERTERLRERFDTGEERAPASLLSAFGLLKKAVARVNFALLPERMNEERCAAIFAAADELIRGRRTGDFPLSVRRAGAESELNDNVNEVIAARGSEMADQPGLVSAEEPELSFAPGGAFPAASRIAAALAVDRLLSAARTLAAHDRAALERLAERLYALPPCASADAPEGMDALVAQELARQTGKPFRAGKADGTDDALREASRVLKQLEAAAYPSESAIAADDGCDSGAVAVYDFLQTAQRLEEALARIQNGNGGMEA
ncbi:MAG: hypothetical protein IJU66_06720 [Oscillospiraceae bacterium]|nr:hypothetical protein [Oscillospiraceae bacterium]